MDTKKLRAQMAETRKQLAKARLEQLADFGKKVKAAREAEDMTQDELSALVGISRPQIANVERGSSGVTLEGLLALCDSLGTDPNTLLGY